MHDNNFNLIDYSTMNMRYVSGNIRQINVSVLSREVPFIFLKSLLQFQISEKGIIR